MELSLPTAADLADLLGRHVEPQVAATVAAVLVAPARTLLERRSKCLRAQLVQLATELLVEHPDAAQRSAVVKAAAVMELLHAGSLIIDDIQDGSVQRRGGPSLHVLYGVPSALCTGNWLYFWPLRLLTGMGLASDVEARAVRCYNDALERAHYGQALDLSVKVDRLARSEVGAYCEAVIALKTGTITALAMTLGAMIAGADAAAEATLAQFGQRFGRALQQFDDLGDLLGRVEPSKRYEDLRQRKPNGVWLMVARMSDDAAYEKFRKAAAQIDLAPELLEQWTAEQAFAPRARAAVRADLEHAFAELETSMNLSADYGPLQQLRQLGETLTHAY